MIELSRIAQEMERPETTETISSMKEVTGFV
nr:MAG TPA: hypothetical protein [Caudoviricetes sp.]